MILLQKVSFELIPDETIWMVTTEVWHHSISSQFFCCRPLKFFQRPTSIFSWTLALADKKKKSINEAWTEQSIPWPQDSDRRTNHHLHWFGLPYNRWRSETWTTGASYCGESLICSISVCFKERYYDAELRSKKGVCVSRQAMKWVKLLTHVNEKHTRQSMVE